MKNLVKITALIIAFIPGVTKGDGRLRPRTYICDHLEVYHLLSAKNNTVKCSYVLAYDWREDEDGVYKPQVIDFCSLDRCHGTSPENDGAMIWVGYYNDPITKDWLVTSKSFTISAGYVNKTNMIYRRILP